MSVVDFSQENCAPNGPGVCACVFVCVCVGEGV